MNSYIVFVDGKQYEVYATTSYNAQEVALKLYTGRKKHPSVSVNLVELAGEQVYSVITN